MSGNVTPLRPVVSTEVRTAVTDRFHKLRVGYWRAAGEYRAAAQEATARGRFSIASQMRADARMHASIASADDPLQAVADWARRLMRR